MTVPRNGPPEEQIPLSSQELEDLDESWGAIVGKTWTEEEVDYWFMVSTHAVADEDKP